MPNAFHDVLTFQIQIFNEEINDHKNRWRFCNNIKYNFIDCIAIEVLYWIFRIKYIKFNYDTIFIELFC